MEKVVKIQSVSDIITNSSSEVFMVYDADGLKRIKELVNAVLSLNENNTYTFDDLFTIEADLEVEEFLDEYPDFAGLGYEDLLREAYLIDEDNYGSYPWVHGYTVTARNPKNDEIAEKLSNLDKIFTSYATYC